jgi:hypothetical protein
MINQIDSIANVIKAGAEVFEILGSVTSDVIKEASRVRGKYAQKDGETDEAYRMRLEFLERKERIREENKSRRQETRTQERLAHRDLQALKCQEKKEARLLRKQSKIQEKDGR